MNDELTPLLTASIAFAYVGGFGFAGRRRVPELAARAACTRCSSCASRPSAISWIEAPYDWAMYAQFPPAIPRMPSWWPLNMTWGGLPSSVPIGYISYFVLPAVDRRRARATERARGSGGGGRIALLSVGLVVGFVWALLFNAMLGARLGVFYYGRVIPGLALFEGTKHQYPLYDAVAMALQMMVVRLPARPDGRRRAATVIEIVGRLEDDEPAQVVGSSRSSRSSSSATSLYLAVFAPHLVTKLMGQVTAGPTEQLFPGVENQPLHGDGWRRVIEGHR